MSQTLAELGEFGLIERIQADLVQAPAVSVGPGDDAAVCQIAGQAVSALDWLIEGVHFRRDWSGPVEIGRKAVAVAVSDIEAMGAYPVAVLVGLAAPGDLPASWAIDCLAGLRQECARAGVELIGGDVSAAAQISLAVTALGESRGQPPVLRSGAQVGDLVALRGRLGWAAAGLAALTRGFRSPRAAVQAYQCPLPPYGAGAEAAMFGATALIDVSDGLVADLGHVARASGVSFDLDSEALTVAEPVRAVAGASGRDPLEFVLSGGEDHALVGAFPFGQVPGGWEVIGRTTATGSQDPTVLVDGQPWSGPQGWRHF
ncbi:MAG: thiamine-phosphate kinase [Propionibacteriaceae bacterium]|jgi:thiamine-monophosphate kinase|nr:thiamine-phosphate kinase [Propionibacteriaceae bacterium]